MKGATFPGSHGKTRSRFQPPLPRRERRATVIRLRGVDTLFQSTLPRRERRHRFEDVTAEDDFNPRSREGSDSNFSQKSSLFSAKINNLFLHYKLFFLLSLFFLQKPLDFVHIYRCESPCIFMFNPYSHTLILS